jgi:hypothetical protein
MSKNRNINFYVNDETRLNHYKEWATKNGFTTSTGRVNLSALWRYALDKITGYKSKTDK